MIEVADIERAAERLKGISVRTPLLQSLELNQVCAGKVLINSAKTLKIAISGAGSVEYLGDPKVTQDISGVGRVKRRESARDAFPAIA